MQRNTTQIVRVAENTPGNESAEKILRRAAQRGEISPSELSWALERLSESRKTPRSESPTRREDILQAATKIFATKGYHVATLQDIADELGLTRPAFYYYFRSKQEILEAVCREAVDHADQVVERELASPAGNYAQTLRKTLIAYASHVAHAPTTTMMMHNFDEMSPDERRRLAAKRRVRQNRVQALLEKGMAAGEFSVREPTIAILTIFEAINALRKWYKPDGRLSQDEVSAVVVDQLLDGIWVHPREP